MTTIQIAPRRRRARAIDKLTDDQVLALARWIRAHRRAWRARLDAAWQRAGEGVAHYSPELQQIRNNGGPSLIQRLRSADVTTEGTQVAQARGVAL
jgi:hypothetical protein